MKIKLSKKPDGITLLTEEEIKDQIGKVIHVNLENGSPAYAEIKNIEILEDHYILDLEIV